MLKRCWKYMLTIVKNINKTKRETSSNRMRSLRFYRKNLFFMYAESLRSPRCQGQSILIKETPTPVHLQYTYTNERKECLLTQTTKERWCQYQLTSLLYRTFFRLSALFFKIFKKFFQRKRQPEIHQIAFSVF